MPSDHAQSSGEAFTSARATGVMAAACRAVGLGSEGAELIRFGENALFRLAAHPVIVRVARAGYLPSVRAEVSVSRWLAREGFPAVRAVDDIEQPLVMDGHPVTFWHVIEDVGREATYGELGAVLRDLHSMPVPEDLELPSFTVFCRADLRIELATGISDDDREFLRRLGRQLRDRLAQLRFQSDTGPVHGDAHTGNLMVDKRGQVHLIDLENFAVDHPEWDLMVAAHEHHRLGWVSGEGYAAFSGAYGRDLGEWHGFPTLCGVQEFQMTTWLMQNISEGADVAAEFARRLESLRDEGAPRTWLPY